jgi:hypothetical protein
VSETMLLIWQHIFAAPDSQRREYNTRSRVLCEVVNRVAITWLQLNNRLTIVGTRNQTDG